MHRLIEIATAEIGVKEIEGKDHNPRIIQYSAEVGFPFRDDETPWCSIFLNWVSFKAGYIRSKSGTAFSWANVGEMVSEPQEGDVILLGKNGNIKEIYHVGLFTGFTADRKCVLCLGGNQSNTVSISKMRIEDVAGYRRLRPDSESPKVPEKPQEIIREGAKEKPKEEMPQVETLKKEVKEESLVLKIPKIKLQKGDSGEDVKDMQICLNQAGYPCGKPDGSFGTKTEEAVKKLQKDDKLQVTGKTNRSMRNALAKRLGLAQESLFDFFLGKDD